MTASAVSTPLVIGGRYLASAAAFEARPQGPLDALDTSTGRAAQVRIVFAADGWDDEGFDEAVARWCALACPGVCGILDHGRHERHRYLVVPPALGMSIERWRATRRPAPAESARLTLGFGRLAERIAAAGFPVDAAGLADLAVGPGPTPFVELPLLGDPAVNDVLITAGAGQRTLAAVLRAASGDAPAGPLAAWLERARSAGFASLAECLDELERCADAAAAGVEEGPIGLDGLFDEDDAAFEARLLPPEPRRWPQRLAAGLGLAVLLALALAAFGQGGGGHEAAAARPPAPRPVVESTLQAPQQPHHRARHRHRPAKRHHSAAHAHRHRPPVKHHAHEQPRATTTTPTTTAQPPAPQPPPPTEPPAPSGGRSLPDPGTLPTLPAPG